MAAARDVVRQKAWVLFHYSHSKKWLVKVERGRELDTHIGVLKHEDAIGKEYGSRIMTDKSKHVYLLRPTPYDHVMKRRHGTQIVYPKEIGYVVARAGIGGGQRILEIGAGGGSFTSFVANIVKPRGHVFSFDADESVKIAQKSVDRAGVSKYVSLHNTDIRELDANADEMPVHDADVVLINLDDPWEVVPHVRRMLCGSGCVLALCPTMNQLERLTASLARNGFVDIETTEQIVRNIEARPGKTRHSFDWIEHTAYLCFARKVYSGRDGRDGGTDTGSGARAAP